MAMNKTIFLFCLVVAAMAMAVPVAKAQLGAIGGLLGLVNINGTVFCSVDGNVLANGTLPPVFPNAQVQLQCGSEKIVVSTATTDISGVFSMILNPIQLLLSTLTSSCNLVVSTPLAKCNASLPSVGGLLTSPLKLVGSTVGGLLSVLNFIPSGFSLLN